MRLKKNIRECHLHLPRPPQANKPKVNIKWITARRMSRYRPQGAKQKKKAKAKRRDKNKVSLEDFEISGAHSNNKIQL